MFVPWLWTCICSMFILQDFFFLAYRPHEQISCWCQTGKEPALAENDAGPQRWPSRPSGHTKHSEQVEHQHKSQVMTTEAHKSPHHPPPRPGRHRQRGMLCKHYIKLRRQARKNIAHLSGHQRYLGNIGFCPIWPVSTKHYANMEGIRQIHLEEGEIENQRWPTKESSRWQCCCSTAVYSAEVENLSASNKKLSSLVVSACSIKKYYRKKV